MRYNRSVNDDDFLDHPDDILGDEDPVSDDDSDLFVLFAEALDPNDPKTVADVEAEWA